MHWTKSMWKILSGIGGIQKGTANLKEVSDPQKMRDMFQKMLCSFLHISMLLETLVNLLVGFGYVALNGWMKVYSAEEWFYIWMGRMDGAREIEQEKQCDLGDLGSDKGLSVLYLQRNALFQRFFWNGEKYFCQLFVQLATDHLGNDLHRILVRFE